jgi:hypothetical protein
MAVPKVPSSSPQDNRPYTGKLIESLFELVEKHERPAADPLPADDDEIMLERRLRKEPSPLTIDEVFKRSGMLGTANPYEALCRSVGRWL